MLLYGHDVRKKGRAKETKAKGRGRQTDRHRERRKGIWKENGKTKEQT